jgi:putative spermidine/putrescine transport system permease protein
MIDASRFPGAPRYGLLVLPAGILFAPFYAAMTLIGAISFVEYPALRDGIINITLNNYELALLDSFNFEVLLRTIRLGLVVGALSAVLATPMAYGIARASRRDLQLTLILLTIIPFLVNALVRVFALTTVLGREGFLNFVLVNIRIVDRPSSFLRSEFAVVMGQTYFVVPFAILIITALMAKLNENIEHAASTLGAGPWQVFFKVTLPRLYPAIFSAGLIGYALSVSAFVVPLILGGDQYKMYSNLIFDQVAFRGDFGRAAAMAVVLLIVSVALAELLRLAVRRIAGR